MTRRKERIERCTATNARGEPCKKVPIKGGTVCSTHGGRAPQVKAAAERRHAAQLAEADAARSVSLWGGRKDVHPATALLELVQWKAAECVYWRARVAEVAEVDLTWGRTKEKSGGQDFGTTEEAKPHIALVLLRTAEQDLAQYAAASLKAGVDERLVQIAQTQAVQLLTLVRACLADSRIGVAPDVADSVIRDHLKELAA